MNIGEVSLKVSFETNSSIGFGVEVKTAKIIVLSQPPNCPRATWGELQCELMNIADDRSETAQQELLRFLENCGYLAIETDSLGRTVTTPKWRPAHLTPRLIKVWFLYRQLTVDLARTPWHEWPEMLQKYSKRLAFRATKAFSIDKPTIRARLGLRETDDDRRGRVGFRPALWATILGPFEPIDLIWLNVQLEKLNGIGYEKCANPKCSGSVPRHWSGQPVGRKRMFHSSECEDQYRHSVKYGKLEEARKAVAIRAASLYDSSPRRRLRGEPRARGIARLAAEMWPKSASARRYPNDKKWRDFPGQRWVTEHEI